MNTRKLDVIGSGRAGDPGFHRRQFLLFATAAAAAFADLGCQEPESGGGRGDSGETGSIDDGSLPSLGGAPDTDEGRTIAAFCDAVVPGKHRDPTGAPGAVDVGVPGMFYDPTLPAVQFVGLLRLVLDGHASLHEPGARFFELAHAERDTVLEAALEDETPLDLAVQLIKAAFYSLPEIAQAMGYPGPNRGYIADPDYSFGEALAGQLTADGNMP